MRGIAERFPKVTKLDIDCGVDVISPQQDKRLAACLASPPSEGEQRRRWATEEVVLCDWRLVRVAEQVPLLCPQLRKMRVGDNSDGGGSKKGAALAAALEALAAVAGTLEELEVHSQDAFHKPGAAARAATALGRLTGLRRLCLDWYNVKPAGLLQDALAPLTALS